VALAKPPGKLPKEVEHAIKVLRLDHLSLVINDEATEWMPYGDWLRKRVFEHAHLS
jgi:hypothetical protein